jgi:tRNA/rRNA methyltransferase
MLYVATAMSLGKVRIVLHRPASAENLGAAARAMKNFGLGRLVVVTPPAWAGAPRSGGAGSAQADVLVRASRLARHASDLLETAAFHLDLRAALGPATWVCGTTSRTIEGRPSLTPRQLGEEVARRAAAGEVALVFGEEQRGLSDAELELCHAVCTIPTSPAYDSMNLAQSVAVLCYELACGAGAGSGGSTGSTGATGARLAGAAGAAGAGPASGTGPVGGASAAGPARHATLEALWERLTSLLAGAGYLNPQNPEHILADWRRLLSRAEPTQREVELLLAAIRALERRLAAAGTAR